MSTYFHILELSINSVFCILYIQGQHKPYKIAADEDTVYFAMIIALKMKSILF